MAVTEKKIDCKLKLMMNVTVEGKTKIVSKTFGRVKGTATGIGIYSVGKGLAGLQVNPLNKIVRMDEIELTETV